MLMSKQEMKKNKNPKIVEMLFARSWCAVCVKGRCVGKHLQGEPEQWWLLITFS